MPGLLDLRADHEPRHVHQEHQRDPERVAQVHEAGRLVGGVVVEDPAHLARLVGDDPDRPPAHARQAGDDRLRPLRLEVEPVAVVDDPPDHVVHVVRLAVGLGEHVEQLLVHAVDGVVDGPHRRRFLAVRREEREVLPDARDALLVVGHLEVADAGLAAVHARPAELLLRDVLADRGAHEVRPRERHRAAALDHRHEVGQPGDVRRARPRTDPSAPPPAGSRRSRSPPRGTGGRSRRTASRPPPGSARRPSRAATRTGSAWSARGRAAARPSSRRSCPSTRPSP